VSIRIVAIDKLKCEKELELKEVFEKMGEILRVGGVKEPIIVDSRFNVVDNIELYEALRRLGVKLVPISQKKASLYLSLESLGFYDEIYPEPLRVFKSTLELLYRNWPTPLVLLRSLSTDERRVWAKLEGFNTFSGSVKDRIGWFMFINAMKKFGGTYKKFVYEATSTNTGMALAAMAAMHGFKARFYLPITIQKASDVLLKVIGADVVRVPKQLTVEFIDDVERNAKRDKALHLNQFENDANFEVHLRYTAKELELQIREAKIYPAAIIGGIGTSGHMSAIAFYFKNRFRENIEIYGVQPAKDHSIPGIRRVETGMKWIHWVKFNGVVDIKGDEAIREAINIARKEGILIGLSSGAVVSGFKKLSREGKLDRGDVILIFPDHGFKYVEQFREYLQKHE